MEDPFFGMDPQFPNQEKLKCPRCESMNTKFCYYNNYNLSQPRHFCKNCKRYWTKGGSLRNIPVGGGSRKNAKRASNSKKHNTGQSQDPTQNNGIVAGESEHSGQESGSTRNCGLLDVNLTFGSLLTSNGQFGSDWEGMNGNGSGLKMGEFAENLSNTSDLRLGMGENPDLESGDSSNKTNGWPDLGIYTPRSSFQ